mgnify:CR=1 FL=1
MISGEGGNVAVNVTDEGVILVDDMFDRNHAGHPRAGEVGYRPAAHATSSTRISTTITPAAMLKMLPIAEVIAHRERPGANLADIKQPHATKTRLERQSACRE